MVRAHGETLEDSVAVVAGAGSGIGRGSATGATRTGARVVVDVNGGSIVITSSVQAIGGAANAVYKEETCQR
jgi:S-adenosylhomocysteine hydrolase